MAFSNGAFHWVVSPDHMNLKRDHVSFDLSTEKFRVQAFHVNSLIKARVSLMDLRGRLCAFFPDLDL